MSPETILKICYDRFPAGSLMIQARELAMQERLDNRPILTPLPPSSGGSVGPESAGARSIAPSPSEIALETRTMWQPGRVLRVRFLAAPHYIYHLHELDREGVLTFEISDFISTLEMASVFRTLLLPDEQTTLRKLLKLRDDAEAQFYWGRFLGQIKPEVRDMLNAWQIRRWSSAQVDLLYRLSEYVRYY